CKWSLILGGIHYSSLRKLSLHNSDVSEPQALKTLNTHPSMTELQNYKDIIEELSPKCLHSKDDLLRSLVTA
ncbi:hypothetical protein BGZ59_003487, partial [Podila verticillata]